jgi:beta-galactosidase
MDRNWQFYLGDIEMHDCRHVWSKTRNGTRGPINPRHDDSHWQTVNLPHDFVLENGFSREERIVKDDFPLPIYDTPEEAISSHGYIPTSVGWYRKRFALKKSDAKKRIWLIFDGIYRDAQFWLNGLYLDRHQSGYNECRMDVTDLLVYGGEEADGNVLAVRVDARQCEGWFYEGGGIYRHVWLEKTDPVAIDKRATFVWTRALSGRKTTRRAELELRTGLRNDREEPVTADVVCTVIDAKKNECAQTSQRVTLQPGAGDDLVRELTVKNPRLWDLKDPHLYILVTELFVDGKSVDRTETAFGIRTIRFDADNGFFLNDRHVKIKGVCVHQNHAGVGTAIPDKLYEYRIHKLQEFGCNAYRCSHYPQAPELLDACDRLGMLVMAESRSFSSGPEFMRQHETMIRRDRNHPSIVIYSMANEEFIQNKPQGERMMGSIRRMVKRLDPSRPLTSGNNHWEGWGKAASRHLDIQGCNYRVHKFDWFHKKYPDKPLIGTENSLRHTTRGVYEHVPERGYVDAYDRPEDFYINRIPAEEMWRHVAERDFVAGVFLWTGIDYKGESKPYKWPAVSSNFGMLDSCCFPKDIAYYFKSWWKEDDNSVHIFPHWNLQGREGELIDVWCYARCDRVELLVNGTSCGMQEMPCMGHAVWQVPYKAGFVEVQAYKGDKIVATKRVDTTGKAQAIEMDTEHTTLWANGEDIAVVNVSIVDQQGRTVPTACNRLRFEVSDNARILGVGNGDPSCHEPDKALNRSAFNGLCQVIIQTTDQPGQITLYAASNGLQKNSLTIKSRKGNARKAID